MYEAFYGLRDQPFRLTPDPSFMCMTSHHQEALAGLVYSVCTRPGLTLLTGDAGTGKTTLLYSLLDLLSKRRYLTATCNNPMLSREELYDLLITKFGVICASSLKNRQLAALEETFVRYRNDGRPAVLIVDEAHRLPMDLLEEIRLLLNMETPREKLLQIILAGQPELDDLLRQPELRQLKQRVSAHCRLRPLTASELKEYVDHRLRLAGMPDQTLFQDAAVQRIHEYSKGIPRLINNLCDSTLQIGFATRAKAITLTMVEEAAKDLDLVPLQELQLDSRPTESFFNRADEPRTNGHAVYDSDPEADSRVPLTSYSTRQKSVSFFAGLVDRWR
jgi:general secretion pathway protein A